MRRPFNPRAPQAACRKTRRRLLPTPCAAFQRYIREGDVFGVNVSRQWDVTLAQA